MRTELPFRAHLLYRSGLFLTLTALAIGLPGFTAAQTPADWQTVAGGYDRPVTIVPHDGRVYVVEQSGTIRVFEPSSGLRWVRPFLDIRDRVEVFGELGLLGLAFSPDFAVSGELYVHYTEATVRDPDCDPLAECAWNTVIARYRVDANGRSVDASEEERILVVGQDFSNHNGGDLHFDLADCLLFAFGDGGSANDPLGRSQDPTTLLGKMVRLDVGQPRCAQAPDAASFGEAATGTVASAQPQREPRLRVAQPAKADAGSLPTGGVRAIARPRWASVVREPRSEDSQPIGVAVRKCGIVANYDLPFGETDDPSAGPCGGVVLSGLRNPYRWSIDRQSGDLWIGDVGQATREEVTRVAPELQPANLGWSICEGSIGPSCEVDPLLGPTLEFDHSVGIPCDGADAQSVCSVVGGPRYRGSNPALADAYLYADYCSGQVCIAREAGGVWQTEPLTDLNRLITCLAEGESGELYACDYGEGTVLRLPAP